MITGDIKNKVDRIWEVFWTGGVVNPLSVIEQITYLLFIRGLDIADSIREKESIVLGIEHKSIFAKNKQHLRWSVFKDLQ
ncbi:MAG: SAM-dependent DNA methyltransferase, partial [Clostridiales bacterium]|nr:SAM-dependent DNA methyltransferase [Clostridiales bacterium]